MSSISRQIPPLPKRPLNLTPLYVLMGVIAVGFILYDLHMDYSSFPTAVRDIGGYIVRFSHPQVSQLQDALVLMGDTLAIAFWGTTLAILIGVLVAPLAAQNLAPPVVYRIVREIVSFFRAMPDLLLTLVFNSSIGSGPQAVVLALGLHMGGFLAKFLAENMERVDKGVYEGMRASGTGFLHLVLYAALPMTLRETVAYAIYTFDRNVRMAAILGLVGGGGIGDPLYTYLRRFQYDRAAGLILILVVTLVLLDQLSSWLRRKLA